MVVMLDLAGLPWPPYTAEIEANLFQNCPIAQKCLLMHDQAWRETTCEAPARLGMRKNVPLFCMPPYKFASRDCNAKIPSAWNK